MQAGINNKLTGTISTIHADNDMTLVTIDLTSTQISSLMTTNYLDSLGLVPGDTVSVITNASNVILVK